ncbi:Delta-aminolevulinic acid dehydratase [Teratosphaeria destructans]|uniref:Delta-aminolevulinic acid dehydratase n=1 Tax=Teratosphaeria destructans TaxID=418781 RepID=A0A9W7SLX9_9PEZI|nr:Delta-aminolevulinic acid dehydratase [Teratosphaeria destructans]
MATLLEAKPGLQLPALGLVTPPHVEAIEDPLISAVYDRGQHTRSSKTDGAIRLHSGYSHTLTRAWQSQSSLRKESFVYPLFISDLSDERSAIPTMPGQLRLGIRRLAEHLEPLVRKGLAAVILFGVISDAANKDPSGTAANDIRTPVIEGIKLIRSQFPELYVICDVCLCEYTDHGHCGILNADGSLDNQNSVRRLVEVAVSYARAGAHCVAPSDMNDTRIAGMKSGLIACGLGHQVSLMSYSAKFHSKLYGPFRDAAASEPAFGDRQSYQLPVGARGLARRAIQRDVQEGADFILVKPAGNYLDIIRDARELDPNVVIAAYQVSGEYASLHAAANAGVGGLRELAHESCEALVRAGATIIISYFTPQFLEWLS